MIRKSFNPFHDTLKVFVQVLSFSFFIEHQARKEKNNEGQFFLQAGLLGTYETKQMHKTNKIKQVSKNKLGKNLRSVKTSVDHIR